MAVYNLSPYYHPDGSTVEPGGYIHQPRLFGEFINSPPWVCNQVIHEPISGVSPIHAKPR